MEIAALVLGIVSLVFSFIPVVRYIAFILGILGIVFGGIAISKAKKEGKFSGMGLTGILTGIGSIVVLIIRIIIIAICFIVILAGAFSVDSSTSNNKLKTNGKTSKNTITSSYVKTK